MTTWNIVAARKGSKGCPGKAIRPLPDGTTCLSRAVNMALALPGTAVITTDYSPEHCDGDTRGSLIYLCRPALLASDESPMVAVIIHALSAVGADMDDRFVLLQASSPLRTVKTVALVSTLCRGQSGCSAMPYPDKWHPRYMLKQDATLPTRRQDLETACRPDGGAYVASVRQILSGSWGPMTWVYSPPAESLSIDTEDDWIEAERRVRAGQ